jgi:hypothetical protein
VLLTKIDAVHENIVIYEAKIARPIFHYSQDCLQVR